MKVNIDKIGQYKGNKFWVFFPKSLYESKYG